MEIMGGKLSDKNDPQNWAVCLYLWPAGSMTSGGQRVISCLCLLSDTVRPAASKTVTMTVITYLVYIYLYIYSIRSDFIDYFFPFLPKP